MKKFLKLNNYFQFVLSFITALFLYCVTNGYCQSFGEPFLVKDINPSGHSYPTYITNVNGMVFFNANDGIHGFELWKTDGTEAGTILVKDINTTESPNPEYLTGSSNPQCFASINGTLFFAANDGIHGTEIWESDGTEAGTLMVKDINPTGDSYPSLFTHMNDLFFFNANDGTHGFELWISDGTETGTRMLKNINPSGGSGPCYLTAMNGSLYFSADDGNHGIELWKSDGSEAGTVMVKDIDPVGDGQPFDHGARFFAQSNGELFFEANDGVHGAELWKSDGTEAGTVMVKDINTNFQGYSLPGNITNLNGMLFFDADDGTHGSELWVSDGTEAGTRMVKDINSTSQASGYATPYGLTSINGMLLFGAYDGIHGTALWKSDGTEAGTVMLKDINPLDLTNAGGMLFFRGYDETLGTEEDNEAQGIGLWKSDGTEAGTVLIKHMELSCNEPVFLIDANSTLFFSVADEFNGLELWALRPLPTFIELSSFTAASDHRKAVLQWSTESEIDNAGFNIYRAAAPDGPFIKINTSLIPAQGAPTQGGSYSFIDSNVLNRKTYWYKLEDVDARGVATLHGPVSATPRLIYGVK